MALKKLLFLLPALALPLLINTNTSHVEAKAETTSGYEATNFVYTAAFKSGQDNGFTFGQINDDVNFKITASEEDGYIYLKDIDENIIKTSVDQIKEGDDYELTLVVNEGIAKVYIDDSKTATITSSIPQYLGGHVSTFGNALEVNFFETDTIEGNIFCGGYTVQKVVNLTDDNYLLTKDSEYTVNAGVITVSETYLRTLAADETYTFRAVTSYTDLLFTVTNDFAGITAKTAVDDNYHGNPVVVEMNAAAEVTKVTIDGEDVSYVQEGLKITIPVEVIDNVETGSHTIMLYTNNGRPTAELELLDIVENYPDIPKIINYTYLYIDLGIFFGLILAYVGFSIYKKAQEERR